MMGDMGAVIIPKSDQINADDLLSGPMTIKISGVKVSSGQEQPVSMFFDGSTKAYRPCKSMARVLVTAWGADSSKYTGRSLTLYCDPKVKWGGMEVGGIRISHMSDIEMPLTMALTVTRANRKPFTVRPLTKDSAAPPSQTSSRSQSGDVSARENVADNSDGQTDYVTADMAVELGDLCKQAGVNKEKFLAKAGASSFAKMLKADYPDAKEFFLSKIQ